MVRARVFSKPTIVTKIFFTCKDFFASKSIKGVIDFRKKKLYINSLRRDKFLHAVNSQIFTPVKKHQEHIVLLKDNVFGRCPFTGEAILWNASPLDGVSLKNRYMCLLQGYTPYALKVGGGPFFPLVYSRFSNNVTKIQTKKL